MHAKLYPIIEFLFLRTKVSFYNILTLLVLVVYTDRRYVCSSDLSRNDTETVFLMFYLYLRLEVNV
jgi:hypothetical protein